MLSRSTAAGSPNERLVRQENPTYSCCISYGQKCRAIGPAKLRFDERRNLQRERPIRQRREEECAAALTSAETCMDYVCCPGTGPRTSKMTVPPAAVTSGLVTSIRSGPVVGLLDRDGHCIDVSAGAAD